MRKCWVTSAESTFCDSCCGQEDRKQNLLKPTPVTGPNVCLGDGQIHAGEENSKMLLVNVYIADNIKPILNCLNH